jgi:hypothetical protein
MTQRQRSRVTCVLTLALLAVITASAGSAHALSLLGAEVTGEFFVDGGSTNLFDPENGKVPDFQYGNSLNVPGNGTNIVPIADPLVEFGYEGSSMTALFTANFTGAGILTLTATAMPFPSVAMNFNSPGFAGLQFAAVADGATNLNCSFANTTIGCIVGPGPGFTSTYNFSSAAQVPEPASLTLLGLGLAGVIACCRRRGSGVAM